MSVCQPGARLDGGRAALDDAVGRETHGQGERRGYPVPGMPMRVQLREQGLEPEPEHEPWHTRVGQGWHAASGGVRAGGDAAATPVPDTLRPPNSANGAFLFILSCESAHCIRAAYLTGWGAWERSW